jgi:glycosyltransferase involved in cell wall biosynthesis
LGEWQRSRLLWLGLSASRVAVVVNSCELEPVSAEAMTAKQAIGADRNRPVRLLHLSSLIDTKGFPEYLEALRSLSSRTGPEFEAVLCGRLVSSEFSDRFLDAASAESWIEREMAKINQSARARVKWIKGAVGAQKAALFREADIFVLPTRYSVEAQPLVLLEAMASGCAIVTTRAGEIPTILDEHSAVFLGKGTSAELAAAIESLLADGGARAQLAEAGHERFLQRYTVEHHLDEWEHLLDSSAGRREDAE